MVEGLNHDDMACTQTMNSTKTGSILEIAELTDPAQEEEDGKLHEMPDQKLAEESRSTDAPILATRQHPGLAADPPQLLDPSFDLLGHGLALPSKPKSSPELLAGDWLPAAALLLLLLLHQEALMLLLPPWILQVVHPGVHLQRPAASCLADPQDL